MATVHHVRPNFQHLVSALIETASRKEAVSTRSYRERRVLCFRRFRRVLCLGPAADIHKHVNTKVVKAAAPTSRPISAHRPMWRASTSDCLGNASKAAIIPSAPVRMDTARLLLRFWTINNIAMHKRMRVGSTVTLSDKKALKAVMPPMYSHVAFHHVSKNLHTCIRR